MKAVQTVQSLRYVQKVLVLDFEGFAAAFAGAKSEVASESLVGVFDCDICFYRWVLRRIAAPPRRACCRTFHKTKPTDRFRQAGACVRRPKSMTLLPGAASAGRWRGAETSRPA